MKDNSPFFSFISIFRNRDNNIEKGLKRVQRNLDSIQKQTYQNFELIFVNNGSEARFSQELEQLLSQYQFIKYIYTETRGFDWNRAYTLNLAIEFTNNPFVIVSDIDLIYPDNFLTKLCDIWDFKEILIYRIYYLPKNFKNYNNLEKEKYPDKLESSQYTAKGIFAIVKTTFLNVGGYDEFYRVWGLEDGDFLETALQKGYQYHFWDEDRVPTFHQWHEKSAIPLLNNLYIVLQRYFENKKQNRTEKKYLLEKTKDRKPLTLLDRPTLRKVLNNDFIGLLEFKFEIPKEYGFLCFMKQFETLKSGEYLLVKQEFGEFSNHKSRLRSLVKFINKILKNIRISYRLVEMAKFQNNKFEWEEIRNFLRYFTLHFSEYLEDYYFKCEYPEVFLLLLKK